MNCCKNLSSRIYRNLERQWGDIHMFAFTWNMLPWFASAALQHNVYHIMIMNDRCRLKQTIISYFPITFSVTGDIWDASTRWTTAEYHNKRRFSFKKMAKNVKTPRHCWNEIPREDLHIILTSTGRYCYNHRLTVSTSVVLIVGPLCTLAMSHAAPGESWWVC